MAIERAGTKIVPKPWGCIDLRPWHGHHDTAAAIGEIWFQRNDALAPQSALLLKLLFTSEPLSIQVHPNDEFARSIGLPHGKSEAWYILSATRDARIALGLKRLPTRAELQASIDDGSIAELIQWRTVRPDDVIFVPAGTIHAIGAGLILVEIQQRSEATFRLFDYGRQRELHPQQAAGAASGELAQHQPPPRRLTSARTLLVTSPPHFVLERFELPPGSDWELVSATETWLFMLHGSARIGSIAACISDAIFLEADSALIHTGDRGLQGLVAYVGSDPMPNLLHELAYPAADASRDTSLIPS